MASVLLVLVVVMRLVPIDLGVGRFPMGLRVEQETCDLTVVIRAPDGGRLAGVRFDLVRDLRDGSGQRVGRYQTDADGRAQITGVAQGRYSVVFAGLLPDGREVQPFITDWGDLLDDGPGVGGFGIYLDGPTATMLFVLTPFPSGDAVAPEFDLAASEFDAPQPFDPWTDIGQRHTAAPGGAVATTAPPYKPASIVVFAVCGVVLWLMGMVAMVGYLRSRAQRRQDEGRAEQ